ncbi:MAG: glutaredoxin 2 [Alphaproteobacteria bacterium]
MFKLYIYDHCPYCTRARMIFGYKNIDYDLRYLLNDDEDNPIRMVGQKMVPILEKEDGSYMPESLDIVHYIDKKFGSSIMSDEADSKIVDIAERINNAARPLSTPRFALCDTQEFATAAAKMYFLKKKESNIGSFAEHLLNTQALIAQAQPLFKELEAMISSPDGIRGKPSIDDVMLYPFLRSFTIVKGMTFPETIHNYLIRQSELTKTWLFDGFAF